MVVEVLICMKSGGKIKYFVDEKIKLEDGTTRDVTKEDVEAVYNVLFQNKDPNYWFINKNPKTGKAKIMLVNLDRIESIAIGDLSKEELK